MGGGASVTSFTYLATVAIGLTTGQIGGVGRYWSGKDRFTDLADPAGRTVFEFFPGRSSETPWGYLQTKHPDQAVGYAGLSYVAGVIPLDSSAALPNYSFEIFGIGMTKTVTPDVKSYVSATGPDWWASDGAAWDGAKYNSIDGGLRLLPLQPVLSYVNCSIRFVFTGSATILAQYGDADAPLVQSISSGDELPLGPFYYFSADVSFSITSIEIVNTTPGTSAISSSVGLGVLDENPQVVVADLLAKALYPLAKVGALSAYSSYCLAANLLVSPVYTEQRAAKDMLVELTAATNSEFVNRQGVLDIVPYADAPFTGNGVTFTPDLTPVYDLTDDDFIMASSGGPGEINSGGLSGQVAGDLSLSSGPDDPIQCTRTPSADAYNHIRIEYADRSQDYNFCIAEAKDQADIETKGLRSRDPIQMHFICDRSIAQSVAQIILQRGLYVRNSYTFKLSWNYCLIEPMDILTLNDALMGLNEAPVRVKEIVEDYNGLLNFTVEECPTGVYGHAIHKHQNPLGYVPNYQADPGNVNPPAIIEAPYQATAGGAGFELWLGLSGGPNWGGADVWISQDNVSYRKAGTIIGSARQGVLTAPLPMHLDPDASNTLSVDLTESRGELLSVTQADADALNTLCYVDGEFLAYQTANLTAANKYGLSYLRRGAYGTGVKIHLSGASFVRLDSAVGKFPFTADLIGKPVYFKLVSFNSFGGGKQDISGVPVYSHTITGEFSVPGVLSTLIVSDSCGADGWPGVKTGCYVDENGALVSRGQDTWGDFAAESLTWAAWLTWNRRPTSPIQYDHTLIDLGTVLRITPEILVDGDGDIMALMSTSIDGVTYSDYLVPALVTARYVKVRAIASGALPAIRLLVVKIAGQYKRQTIDDLDTATLTGAYRLGIGDVRLPLTLDFAVVARVSVTIQTIGVGGAWLLVDKDPVLGPHIRLLDGFAATDAVIDAVIEGY